MNPIDDEALDEGKHPIDDSQRAGGDPSIQCVQRRCLKRPVVACSTDGLPRRVVKTEQGDEGFTSREERGDVGESASDDDSVVEGCTVSREEQERLLMIVRVLAGKPVDAIAEGAEGQKEQKGKNCANCGTCTLISEDIIAFYCTTCGLL